MHIKSNFFRIVSKETEITKLSFLQPYNYHHHHFSTIKSFYNFKNNKLNKNEFICTIMVYLNLKLGRQFCIDIYYIKKTLFPYCTRPDGLNYAITYEY